MMNQTSREINYFKSLRSPQTLIGQCQYELMRIIAGSNLNVSLFDYNHQNLPLIQANQLISQSLLELQTICLNFSLPFDVILTKIWNYNLLIASHGIQREYIWLQQLIDLVPQMYSLAESERKRKVEVIFIAGANHRNSWLSLLNSNSLNSSLGGIKFNEMFCYTEYQYFTASFVELIPQLRSLRDGQNLDPRRFLDSLGKHLLSMLLHIFQIHPENINRQNQIVELSDFATIKYVYDTVHQAPEKNPGSIHNFLNANFPS